MEPASSCGDTLVLRAVHAVTGLVCVQREKDLCVDPLFGVQIAISRTFKLNDLMRAVQKESAETN
jgi:hypothetical protein